jgi:hypothetical protein
MCLAMDADSRANGRVKMAKTIGTTTRYSGTEHGYLRGHKVRIVAVLKNAARPAIDVDGPDYAHIDDEDELVRAGGVTADDRVEVQPWLEEQGRFSFVTSDPRAIDMACFAHLRRARIPN